MNSVFRLTAGKRCFFVVSSSHTEDAADLPFDEECEDLDNCVMEKTLSDVYDRLLGKENGPTREKSAVSGQKQSGKRAKRQGIGQRNERLERMNVP